MSEKKLFLLDAMALIYRAYFALNRNPQINSKGLNTSAILGFTNTLTEILTNEKPTHIAVAFDTQAPTVRHIEFTEYKANRDAMPEDIASAIPYIMKIIEAFNIPIISLDGYEADDVIGTFAKIAEKEGFKTFMMTPDKDYGQLVSENIFMYKPSRMGNKPEVLGVDEICKKFGIKKPEQLIDILGLWGDSSDNIPGIPGIGEKRAKEFVSEYGSVENLIENAANLKGKMKENVEKFAEQGLLSKKLATIILDVPIEFNEDELKLRTPDFVELKSLFDELEFKTLAKRFFQKFSQKDEIKTVAPKGIQGDLFGGMPEIEDKTEEEEISEKRILGDTEHTYVFADTEEKRNDLIDKLSASKSFCFDTETSSLNIINNELVGISFAIKTAEAYYVPIPDGKDDAIKIINEFKNVLENENIEKIGQNLKFDISILKLYDIYVKGKLFDTMIAHYLIEPEMRHNMDFLAETYLDYSPVSIESLIGKKGKSQLSMRSISPERVSDYACEDADITLQLKEVFEPMLKENNLVELFENIEMPLVDVLSTMEIKGVNIDVAALNQYSLQLQDEISIIEKEIFELAGIKFNIASPKQLGDVLFEHLKIIDNPKKTKTKQYSTGEEVLVKLLDKHPIVSKILEFRSLSKLKSTYVDALPEMKNSTTGRVHASFNQAVTATGRLSSNNPNLQNIPIRTDKGKEIRKAFIPESDKHKLLAADYSQVELRLIAELSEDESMTEAFLDGVDIHTATASKVYNVDIEDVTKEQRRNAKMVNFGIIYGISPFGLAERLKISRKEAKEIIDQYFMKYPGIRDYMDEGIVFARENGYVETIMGRRRYLRDINSRNAVIRNFAERNAINAPIQGSSADMIKIAMINIYKKLVDKNFKTKMVLQVHDELVFDVPIDELDEIKDIVKNEMINAVKLKIPVVVDMSDGDNWLQAH